MEDLKKEIRYFNAELRANPDTGTIDGTAIIFNQESRLLGGQFREIIKSEAVSESLLSNSEITMFYNHNQDNGVLAKYKRGAGTLKIFKDERGVHFSFKPRANSALAQEVKSAIEAGDLEYCSFGFTLEPQKGNDTWSKRSDGTYLREIRNFTSLFDFSIVVNPAYLQTSVSTRGLEDFKEQELQEIRRLEEINEYYKPYEYLLESIKK
jgi:hypothetical protein